MKVVLASAALAGVLTLSTTPVSAQSASPTDSLNNIEFRNLGPSVAGGRVTSVVGVPGKPNIYYVGAAGGGVWKTTDAGYSWDAIFTKEPPSIGAIALAPSNPNLVWVGTGESNIRNDNMNGHGIFFSPDGGKTWQAKGLENAGQIGDIAIDPRNPDIVIVAVMGHAWTTGPDRGVYRTADGGKTWQRVLFVNDTTGAVDLAMDPDNPRVIFAAMWQVQRHPWGLDDGGAGSGLWRSKDEGLTWEKLTNGLPSAPIGRIAIGEAPSNPDHLYALMESKHGMLWVSHDLGDHWSEMSNDHALDVRPFYFSRVIVAPDNENRAYFLSYQMRRSDDGGKTSVYFDRGVHVDHHALWIDPQNADRMIQGNDGGAYVSIDGGANWRFLNNLPIEQFYMVAADNNHPYTLCGGLQDNNAWCGPSSGGGGFRGGDDGGDWYTVAGGDGEYAVPAPSDSTIIYAESQNGSLSRTNLKTGERRSIRPYEPGVEDEPASHLKYRFNWTTPIAVSRTDANTVYMGANVVFKTTDGGRHWKAISPDLTRNEKDHQQVSGGPINHDISGAETYNTILTVDPAPTDSKVIWAGTDDGYVWVTKDGGANWTNVTKSIKGLPQDNGGRINQIGISPFDAGTAYLAFDYHEYDNDRPYVYKTTNYGQSWTDISKGLPDEASAVVVREDPHMRNFLVLGTDEALFMSRDGGQSWQPLHAGFPNAPVFDLKFVDHDLVVATHGRGLFVLDHLTPLEQLTPKVADADLHLFSVAPGVMWQGARRNGPAVSRFSAPSAPRGVILDYYLKTGADTSHRGMGGGMRGPGMGGRGGAMGPPGRGGSRGRGVKIAVFDQQGDTVYTGNGPAKMGVNRAEWGMRYTGPEPLHLGRASGGGGGFFRGGFGPSVVPGTYTVTVSFKGKTDSAQVEVKPDPRRPADPAAFAAQTKAALELRNQISALNTVLNRIHGLDGQLQNVRTAVDAAGPDSASYAPVRAAARRLGRKLRALNDSLYNTEVQPGVGEDDVHYLSRFHDRLQGLMRSVSFAYASPPSDATQQEWTVLKAQLDQYLNRFNTILSTDVPQFNQTATQHHAPTLVAGPPVAIQPVKGM